MKLRTESLASILEGGVAFGTLPGPPTARVPADTAFTLINDQDRAMRPSETEISTFVMYFGGSLRGLSAGAPVELQGITVGEVRSLDVEYDERAKLLAFPVMVELYPQRLRGRRRGAHTRACARPQFNTHALIDSLVAHGLRAELKTGNLLTGQKFVSLEMHHDVAKEKVAWSRGAGGFSDYLRQS